MNKFITV